VGSVTSALNFKVDKLGSISESESEAALLARVGAIVPTGAAFTDTVWSPTDVTDGSLEISHVAQLGAVLSSLQTIITPGHLSIAMTSGLQTALNVHAAGIAAIPVTQIHMGGGVFQDQSRFSIKNAELVLDVGMGLWNWRVLPPLYSQIQLDSTRLVHARMGQLPLPATSSCLCYFPCAGEFGDMAAGLHLVQRDSDETQGAWGV